MHRKALFMAGGSVLTALLVGCSLSSPEALAGPGSLTGDTHLTILQTTDIHDHASGTGAREGAGPGTLGSYARIAGYVNAVRAGATDSPVVLVDSGDWTMGTLYDLTLGQQPLATFFLDTLRYDCATLGNHEFDYTPKGLATMLSASQGKFGFHTPIVASNLKLNANADLAPYVGSAIRTTYTETLSTGLKVGFIGLMGKDAAADAPTSAPVAFDDYSKDYTTIQKLVTDLRTTQGCNVVIALSHAGTDVTSGGYTGEDVDLAKHVTGIDVIASGHTHNPFGVLDANAAHPVTANGWTTEIICAGAYSSNVARIDLKYNYAAKTTSLVAASNLAMTDTGLATQTHYAGLDSAASVFVAQADASLNFGLSALFTQFFPDYNATDITKGVYHPVGGAAQDMISNDQNAVLSPNGMGNLCADSLRNVPNAIISKALLAAGWNGSFTDPSLPAAQKALAALNYDPTPYTAAVVPTGVIRDYFPAGATISFAMAYDVLPLGISPDSTQSIPVGYPLMSVYLSYADLQKVCALQLVSQTNLTPSNFYLNLSGISYALDNPGVYKYLKSATAAAVLKTVSAKALAGNAAAGKAYQDLGLMAKDSGAALLADLGTNVYATALVALNDFPASVPPAQIAAGLTPAQIGANLQELGKVATLAGTDAATTPAGITLETYIINQALGAVGQVSAFSLLDPTCVGPVAALDASARYRVAGDLYSVLMMGAVQSQFGVAITPYAAATGTTTVSSADLAGALKYRINLLGPGTTVQELKAWMALVEYLITPPALGGHFTNGTITNEYKSTALFTDFANPAAAYGKAVTVRNASYVQALPGLGQFMLNAQALAAAP